MEMVLFSLVLADGVDVEPEAETSAETSRESGLLRSLRDDDGAVLLPRTFVVSCCCCGPVKRFILKLLLIYINITSFKAIKLLIVLGLFGRKCLQEVKVFPLLNS